MFIAMSRMAEGFSQWKLNDGIGVVYPGNVWENAKLKECL